jgi:uncharacterized membrane protein YhaH (DUF805 family)
MKKLLEKKSAILFLGCITVLVIVYLISSLGRLEFKAARSFQFIQETGAFLPAHQSVVNGIFIVVVMISLLFILIYVLLNRDQRKKFLWGIACFVLAGIVILWILSIFSQGIPMEQQPENNNGLVVTLEPGPTGTPEPEIPLAEFTPSPVSSWVAYLVTLVILLVAVGVWGWLILKRRSIGPPYEALGKIAHSALSDLEAGKDWGNTILNSYSRMNEAVADWRGIRRRDSMTPAEFADHLVSTHLPSQAVFGLTKLFERVRYGDKRSTQKDIQEAVDCLTAILDYCQGAK